MLFFIRIIFAHLTNCQGNLYTYFVKEYWILNKTIWKRSLFIPRVGTKKEGVKKTPAPHHFAQIFFTLPTWNFMNINELEFFCLLNFKMSRGPYCYISLATYRLGHCSINKQYCAYLVWGASGGFRDRQNKLLQHIIAIALIDY